MADIVTPEKRSKMMAGIRGKNTRPELLVRQLLFSAGYRFKLHRRDLPGIPDIVLPRYRVAILVHGCFWHVHAGCRYAKLPSSNREFWQSKLQGNRERDQRNIRLLMEAGWRVLVVWECNTRVELLSANLAKSLTSWLKGRQRFAELPRHPMQAGAPGRRTRGAS